MCQNRKVQDHMRATHISMFKITRASDPKTTDAYVDARSHKKTDAYGDARSPKKVMRMSAPAHSKKTTDAYVDARSLKKNI